jgi:hydrogenase expression/formation protein HypC
MCLGIPGRVEKIDGNKARVSFGEVTVSASLDLLDDPVSVGDFLIVHAGFALERLDEQEAGKTLDMLREISELETH